MQGGGGEKSMTRWLDVAGAASGEAQRPDRAAGSWGW